MTIPVAESRTPLERWLDGQASGELAWRPNTKRNRLHGAGMRARLSADLHVVFMHVVWADRPPRKLEAFARDCNMRPKLVERSIAHLEMHHWIERVDGRLVPTVGLDCGCRAAPKPVMAGGERPHPGATALYRLLGQAEALLYIGIADDPRQRMRGHHDKPWWPEVKQVEIAWYETREAADSAETLAIAAENPIHNKAKRPPGWVADVSAGQDADCSKGALRDEGDRGWGWPEDSHGAEVNEAS